jgi:LPXTG-motif cell wall-anchored protein
MAQTSDLAKLIGFAAANHPSEMVAILTRNGVIVPTETLTTKMLVELIINALYESPSFHKDFTAWAESKASSSFTGPLLPDGSTTSGGGSKNDTNWLGAGLDTLKLGFGWLQGRQQVRSSEALAAAEAARLEAERTAREREEQSFAGRLALSQASTTKVVVFGLLGLTLIGGAIWYFTRKK